MVGHHKRSYAQAEVVRKIRLSQSLTHLKKTINPFGSKFLLSPQNHWMAIICQCVCTKVPTLHMSFIGINSTKPQGMEMMEVLSMKLLIIFKTVLRAGYLSPT